MGKQCELCDLPARMFCESDQASLCWECDAKVHGANFLVARHCRRLLCRSCQEPTPWRAAGSRLGSTESVCDRCCLGDDDARLSDRRESTRERGGEGDGRWCGEDVEEIIEGGEGMEEESEEYSEEDDYEDEEDVDDEYADVDEEDGDNQVVPWSTDADAEAEEEDSSLQLTMCSSSDESSSGRTRLHYDLVKRSRANDELASSHDTGCSPCYSDYLRDSTLAKPESYPGRTPEAGDTEEEEASSYMDCSIRRVRPRHESAWPSNTAAAASLGEGSSPQLNLLPLRPSDRAGGASCLGDSGCRRLKMGNIGHSLQRVE